MKALYVILSFAFLTALNAHAETRCLTESVNAVTAQAQIDFPGTRFIVSMPDLNNVGDERVETYTMDVINANPPHQLMGRYSVMINETCQIMSGPTPVVIR